jgi:hypothetical protein
MSKPPSEPFAAPPPPAVSPSRALVSAALAGLLCAATPACEATKVDDGTENVMGPTCCTGGASASGSGAASSTGGNATIGGASGVGGAVTGTGGLGAGGGAQSAGGTPADAAVASTGGADGGSIVPLPGDAGVRCRMDGGVPVITSSVVVTDMTLEKFTADCDVRHGVVEIPPHCGGFNTCMGMSYDSGTQTLTLHTCRGMNTCVGFSCVLCPP